MSDDPSILLLGENHGDRGCLEREREIWESSYWEGREYAAVCYGRQILSNLTDDVLYREFRRLEDAEEFPDGLLTGEVLPWDNYPMPIEAGQILAVDLVRRDGTVERNFYRAEDSRWQGRLCTRAFQPGHE